MQNRIANGKSSGLERVILGAIKILAVTARDSDFRVEYTLWTPNGSENSPPSPAQSCLIVEPTPRRILPVDPPARGFAFSPHRRSHLSCVHANSAAIQRMLAQPDRVRQDPALEPGAGRPLLTHTSTSFRRETRSALDYLPG